MNQPKRTRFTLKALLILVAVCAVETAFYAEFGLIDWVGAHLLLFAALITAIGIRRKRLRALSVFVVTCVLLLGFLLPAIPSMEEVIHQTHICTKCGANQYRMSQMSIPRGFRPPGYVRNRLSHPIETAEVTGGSDQCGHAWAFESSSMTAYGYLFGLRVPSVSETVN